MKLISVVFALSIFLSSTTPTGAKLNRGSKAKRTLVESNSTGPSSVYTSTHVSNCSPPVASSLTSNSTDAPPSSASPSLEAPTQPPPPPGPCVIPRRNRARFADGRLDVTETNSLDACCETCRATPGGACRSWWRGDTEGENRRCYLNSNSWNEPSL